MYGVEFATELRDLFGGADMTEALDTIRSLKSTKSESAQDAELQQLGISSSGIRQKVLRCINATHEPTCKSGIFDDSFEKDYPLEQEMPKYLLQKYMFEEHVASSKLLKQQDEASA